MTDQVITVEDLLVRYPNADRPAVAGMSFSVARGEVFGFLGPSGAGKSTTQRVLTRLLRRYEGEVRVLGRPLRDRGADYFERVGVGFELPAGFGKLTARENLAAFASLYRGPVEDPGELLARVDLADAADRRVDDLSKGMRMRLNLARALVNRPELLFLDEPTSGQDPVRSALLREVVREAADRGCTVFLTTHDMATADLLCDRVAFVAGGRIVAVDTPRGFKLRHGRPGLVVRVRGQAPREMPMEALTGDAELLELLRRGEVETLHTREASLDEVFATVTRERL
ncbi:MULTISPECIES: ABC transporter ATP-binding protein [Nocardiopsis]|uniref:ABC transporter related protein n=1 Tax=Nocardiopsis dassonvillei (strain ATCC 23218 / DSM 43111 / CIP 107115 / JCM 7437 / KCTC 9190 / NBRC 14626 / NCTC 10488 / NRRL B-5397 / IMRU 509) TaxID=446468 RepID=D7B4R7_NOCDD|nr:MULTISPECIES: ABC transporter ATP-binding protein [Nocardiopsis]ADH67107.1 ABC transporter related protein [Nocardiopsis dassonvillei subsp. dassonvillei DSM 43111]APC35346.1 ATP-binding protein [Nocardiopsis dassonvillei]NKY82266.1 ABC transporter ATP-binding protein [Nocardiopsis dassonvillei]VEI87044.1 Fluoroquinolones export ATP-binding protein Rv2688c/MT2762 [Nocardiopsis dassonvillei]